MSRFRRHMITTVARSEPGPWFGLLVISLLLSGCASTGPRPGPDVQPLSPTSEVTTSHEAKTELRNKLARWNGTPHRWGGTTMNGVDCSGLLYLWYPAIFGIHLPRTTTEQARMGTHVQRRDLETGDLVFFRISRKTQHVGVYLSDGEFAHASRSAGVTTSHLDEPYWGSRYWMARRVVDLSSSPTLHARTESSSGNAPASPRAPRGW